MIDGAQLLGEDGFYCQQIAESEWTLGKSTVGSLGVDDAVDQVADAFLCVFR